MRHHYDNSKDSKTIIAFLVVLLSFSCLLLFWQYNENILVSGYFNVFMSLVFVAMGLFVGLLYLLTKEAKPAKVNSKSKRKK